MAGSKLLISFLFWLALLTDCFFIVKNYTEYRVYTKPLLVPLLLLSIYIESRETKHERSKLLTNLAFFFCFIGDFLLIKDSDSSVNFILGISSFLIAQLFFISFFYRLKHFTVKNKVFTFLTACFVIGYITLLLFIIWTNVSLQNLEIPVAVYAVVLGFMLVCALNTVKNRSIKRIALNYFIPGAALFILSDSILAINKFSQPFYYGSIAVMLTYGAAIFLLATGIARFLKK